MIVAHEFSAWKNSRMLSQNRGSRNGPCDYGEQQNATAKPATDRYRWGNGPVAHAASSKRNIFSESRSLPKDGLREEIRRQNRRSHLLPRMTPMCKGPCKENPTNLPLRNPYLTH